MLYKNNEIDEVKNIALEHALHFSKGSMSPKKIVEAAIEFENYIRMDTRQYLNEESEKEISERMEYASSHGN